MKYGLSWSTSDGLVHVGEQALAWILHQPAFLKNQAGAKFRLEQSWRPVKDAEINAIPDSTDGKWVKTTIGTMEMLSALGLVWEFLKHVNSNSHVREQFSHLREQVLRLADS